MERSETRSSKGLLIELNKSVQNWKRCRDKLEQSLRELPRLQEERGVEVMKIIESKTVGQSVTRWQVYSQHHNQELLGHVGTIYKTPRFWFKAEGVDHEEIGFFETLEDAINAIGERFRWPV